MVKSGEQYNDGIPPNEIRDQVLKELLLEAKNILPPQMYELIIKTSQPLIQPIYDLESNFMVNKRLITIGDAAFTARPHVGMGVTKAAIDAFSLSNSLSSNNYLNSLSKWEKDRIKAGKFLVNRSRELGIYLSKPMKNETLIMPDILNVLSDTAISLYEIKNYEK